MGAVDDTMIGDDVPAQQPCTFQEFATIHAAMFRSPGSDRDRVLSEHGVSREQWRQWNRYWGPRLAADMGLQEMLARIMQQST